MRLIRSQLAALTLTAAASAAMAQGMMAPVSPVLSAAPAGGLDMGAGATGSSMMPSGAAAAAAAAAQNPSGEPSITNQADAKAADGTDPGSDLGAATLREPLVQNEFQRFVFASTGQNLPLFGQRYFAGSPRTFAPAKTVPVSADYVLGPGDELQIRAWGSVDVDYRATIDRNGQISIPRVGTFGVAGTRAGEVTALLRSQIGRIFKNFSLNVTLGQLRSVQIFVVGQARRPGSYTVSSLSTLVNVVFANGGPGSNGSMRNIQLKRKGQVVATLDLYDFIVNGSQTQDVRVQEGDAIVFGTAGPRVALLGSLDTPAIYELKGSEESIAQVLAYGGGTRASTNTSTAQLERIDPSNPKSPRSVSTVDLGAASSTTLRDGDLLTLFGVSPQFANAVTLRGNVAAPLRYPYTPGMRISQLIPDRDALITPDYYLRKNKLVQFTESRDVSQAKIERDVRNIVDEPNWEYAAIERLDTDRVTPQIIPFNLGKAVIEHDPQNDLVLQPGDVVTIFGHNDIRNPIASQTRLVRIEGEVRAPGVYQLLPGETMQRLIGRVGGLTPEAYVFGTEFSREETRKKQQLALDDAVKRLESQLASSAASESANLATSDTQSAAALRISQAAAAKAQLNRLKTMKPNGRIALELDTAATAASDLPDIPLEDGDRINIPHRPAFVFAVGSVDNDNALIWKPKRELKNYLTIAGVNRDADEDNIFVLRADGSVINNRHRGMFQSSLESTELMPGDTVVVPDLINRETFWGAFTRGLKDWSQILYQFGLSAAAIKTLRQ
jgi:protein involved in polysaccharide export with SLBB domain